MLSLYEKIDSLCKQKGTNITKMCKEAGVSRSILSDYKAGRTKDITTDSLKKIATYLNISTDYLLGNEQKEKPISNGFDELQGVYLNFAKEAQKNDIDPDDIRLALDTIKRLKDK